jgi:PAS domain S-box-containing protein
MALSVGGQRSARSLVRERERDAPDRLGRTVWVVIGLMGVLLVGYLIFLSVRTSWNFSPWLDGWLVVAFEVLASGLCAAAALRRARHRRVALLLGVASLSWAIGDLFTTLESLNGRTPPDVGPANWFWLGFFPIALLAIGLYQREELKLGHVPNWLDGAIAALGVAGLCAALSFQSLAQLIAHPALGDVVNLAYPIGDVLLLGMVAGSTVVVSGRSRATLALIAIGLTVNAVGDTFAFAGTGGAGNVVNTIAWPISLLLIAASMWIRDSASDRFSMHAVSGLVLPTFVTGSSAVILVLNGWSQMGPAAVALSAVTLGLVGVRLAFRPALRIARAQLRASEDRYRLLFEQNPQPMVVYDRNTLEIVDVSDAMVAHYGYTRDELESMTIKDLLPPAEVDLLVSYLARNPNGSRPSLAGRPEGYPGHHRLKDGTIIDIEATSTNLDLNGRDCRIAHFDDVTQRNRAAEQIAAARDQAVEASNLKSAFLANVSHEIRTPMNGVIGMTELLLDTELSEEQRDFANQVARSGEQMLSIINDVLDLSKIETGHLELDVGDFDLHDTITETCSVAAGQARVKGLRLDVVIDPDVPRRRRGDGRRLRQIVLNLVANAVKFTAAGTVSVRVSAAARPNGASTIRVEVSDTGIGIDPGNLERMFEPFTQADASTTRQYGGTGLGLAIARELVEMMQGTIGATSTPGQGSSFTFEVELAAPDTADQRAETGELSGAPAWAEPPLVLVAEDSQINQIVATRALERCGCRAVVVGDGIEALAALEAQRFALVLMDCQMPNMDGYEATAELRRRERDRHTPVVATTAHAMDGDKQRCLDAGMDDYISKPMRHADLASKLRQWIPAGSEPAASPPPTPHANGRRSHAPGTHTRTTTTV